MWLRIVFLFAPAAALRAWSPPAHDARSLLVRPRDVSVSGEVLVDSCGVEYDATELENRLRVTSYLYPQKVDIMKGLEPFVDEQIKDRLLEPATAWQPSDFVPDLTQDGWEEAVKDFRKSSEGISDDLLVVLIGDMVTEEALPTYQTLLNTFEGTDDPTGVSDNPWARWSRQWTSEENRHGDLLNRYLYLTGRCDMRAVECTVQRLIASGFNAGAAKDPYRGFIYTSFQERATKISHGNVGRMAAKMGDSNLARICATIAGDEARHEKAYQAFVSELFHRDPNGAVLAFQDMMKAQITMPAQLMDDGLHTGERSVVGESALFSSFAQTAQRLGVYTVLDYAKIMEHLVSIWNIENLQTLNDDGLAAQQYLCKLPGRYMKLAERSMHKQEGSAHKKVAFSWINGRMA